MRRLAVIAAVVMSACIPLSVEGATVNVSMGPNYFTPANITIQVGDTVTWRNTDSMAHTVTARGGAFDSGTMQPGASFSRTFTAPGTYTYDCVFHNGMTGTISVVAASPQTPVQTAYGNQPAEQLAAQAEALLLQIAALQAQLAAQTGTTAATPIAAACPNIGRTLRVGASGDDVARLQQFLAADPSIYPEALVTGYFGSLTEAAVKRWQAAHQIVSSGDAESTGYGVVGPRTAAAIALQCSGASSGTSNGNPTVGGFIQVTPISGNAPLNVSVTATVNTVNSCDGATYTLDWGDQSAAQTILSPVGRCGSVQQILTHTYVYGGTYLVRLSAGQHSTTASVVVNGTGAPVVQIPGTVVTIPSTPTGPTLPASISVNTNAGSQPLSRGSTVTITWSAAGTIPQNSQVELTLVDNSGQRVGNTILATANMAGTYQWQLPSTLAGGQYWVRASVLRPGAQLVAYDDSSALTVHVAAPFTYGPLGITPSVSNNPLAVAASFNIPTSCTGYALTWGDGTNSTQSHSSGCDDTAVTRIFTHEYAASGSYTITLRRGPDLSQVDTASIVISN